MASSGSVGHNLDNFSDIINYSSPITSTILGSKYTLRPFLNSGYWRAVNGNYYSLSLTMKGVKGWNFYANSANLTAKSISFFSKTTNTLGYLSTAYSAYKFLNNPNWLDGTETGVGVGSYFFWEVGATYYTGKFIVTTQRSALNTLIDNGYGDNPAVVNPVTW